MLNYKEDAILDIFLKDKRNQFPYISKNPHTRVNLKNVNFVDFNSYKVLA